MNFTTQNTRKRITIIMLLLLFFNNLHSQTNDPLQYLYDHYGNKYLMTDVLINTQSQATFKHSVLIPCNSGIFELYYEDGCGMENTSDVTHNARRAIVCQVFKDISDFINTPLKNSGNTTKVRIQIRDITATSAGTTASTSTIAGLASSYYSVHNPDITTGTGGITDNIIYKTINSGIDPLIASITQNNPSSSSLYHGYLSINFSNTSFDWNTNLTNITPLDKDLYSIVLHEVSHALGIQSLINYDGKTVLPNFTKNFYSRYDRFLKTNANLPLLSTTATGTTTNSTMYGHTFSANTSTLYTNCNATPPIFGGNSDSNNCTKNLKYVGIASTTPLPVYTPNCFEAGSSLSHFEDLCFGYANNAYFLMSNTTNSGSVKRYYTPEERNVLCDIGYSVKTTFGTHAYTGATVCGGNRVVGVDDGITNGQYTIVVNSGIASSAISVLNNDTSYNTTFTTNNVADLKFEGLQDITAASTITINGNTFTFSSTVLGFHVLRYVPYSKSTGQRGNITYVFIYVRSNANCNVSPCNYVNNSGFESASSCGQILNKLNCWYEYCFSGAVISRNNCSITNFTTGLSTFFTTTPIETHNSNNNNFVMLNYGGTLSTYNVISSRLSIPIIPSNTYRVSYWSRVSKKNGSILNTNTSIPINISLLPNTASTAPLPYAQAYILGSQDFSVYYPTSLTLSHSDVPNDDSWHFYSQTFSVPSSSALNLETIAVYSGKGIVNGTLIFLDDVAIRPINQEGTLDLPPSICSSANLTNLTNYLTDVPLPANGVFEGVGISLNGGVYSFNPASLTTGNYTITYTYTNTMGCPITISDVITVNAATPVFSSIPPTLCKMDGAPILPTTSSNGITGTWSPSAVNTTVAGTFSFTFTPSGTQCATALTKQIIIKNPVRPIFDEISTTSRNTICEGSDPPLLPTVSLNNFSGTWNPAVVSSAASGNYQFTPSLGQCVSPLNISFFVLLDNAFAANDDTFYVYTATAPVATPSVSFNDTYNGGPIPVNVVILGVNSMTPWDIIPVGTPPTIANGDISFDTTTGIFTIAPGTTPGTYIYNYSIATGCHETDPAKVTIIVNPPIETPARLSFEFCYKNNGINSDTSITQNSSLYSGVTIGGTPIDYGIATITTSPAVLPITINNYDGTFVIAPGTLPQFIQFYYTITIGGTTTSSIFCGIEIFSTLQAIVDNVTFNSNGSGTYNVLSNDWYFGDCSAPVTANPIATTSNVTVTQSPTPVNNYYSIDNFGNITLNSGGTVPSGTYILNYQICDKIYPLICQTATVTITVPSSFAPTTNPVTSKKTNHFNIEETITNPNPTSSKITLYFSAALPNDYKIEIYDMFGRKIVTKNLEIGSSQYDIDLQNFSTGNYIIKLYDDNGNSFYKKIMKI